MASLTRWTWVWVSSSSWWWTGRPGVLQSMGSQRVGWDWATELNWTEPARKRALTRNSVRWHLDLRLSRLQNCEKQIPVAYAIHSVVFCYGSLGRARQPRWVWGVWGTSYSCFLVDISGLCWRYRYRGSHWVGGEWAWMYPEKYKEWEEQRAMEWSCAECLHFGVRQRLFVKVLGVFKDSRELRQAKKITWWRPLLFHCS